MVDQPLTSGPVDGKGKFHGYPTLGSGSTGYPDAAAVLRSYLGHPAFEVLLAGDEMDEKGGALASEDTRPERGFVYMSVRTATATRYPSIDYDERTAKEVSELVIKYQLDAPDARAGVVLYRVGNELEADLVVTGRGWLLAERGRPYGKHLANVASPEEALALMGLYLRWHRQPVVIGGQAIPWHPTAMRRSAAFIAMPAFERWNQAGRAWCDTNGDLTLESLNQTCLTRVSRAFKFRDNIFGLSATMTGAEPEEMLCELDSLLFTLVGAFDVAARAVDHILRLDKSKMIGWQSDRWRSKLQAPAKALYDYTAGGTEMQRTFQVLRWLRNSVHNEALDLIRDEGAYVVTMPLNTQADLRAFLQQGHFGWTVDALGIQVLPPTGFTAGKWLPGTGRYSVTVRRRGEPAPAYQFAGQLVVDVRHFINKILPAPYRLKWHHAAHPAEPGARL